MMIKVLVLLIGGLAIGFILWWFFGKHATTTVTASAVDDLQQVDVEVKGGYSPEQIVLKKGFRRYLILRAKMHLVVWITWCSVISVSIRNCHKIKLKQLRLIRVSLANINGPVGWTCFMEN